MDTTVAPTRRALTLVAVSALALLGACSRNKGSYFPLDERLAWQYAVTAQPNGKPAQRGESSMRMLPKRDLDGKQVAPQSVELGGGFATIYRVEDKEGVHVIATQAPAPAELEYKTDTFDLRYPLVAGRSWDDYSESMFVSGSPKVTGESRIEAIDDVVTVPAGTYKNCVRVRFTTVDGSIPYGSDLTINSLRWFAPGVGMVKYQQEEKSDDKGGTFTAELKSFKQL